MKHRNAGLLLLGITFSAQAQVKNIETNKNIALSPYPKTEKVAQMDNYFGTAVDDPYRWMEDDRSEKTKSWVQAENKVTEDYLAQIPFREAIRSRLSALWNYEKLSAPFTEGAYTYYYKNNGLQNQYVLYRKNKDGTEEVFLDPNLFSADGTTSLAGITFSKDGSLVAYQLSEGGSDWSKVIVMDAVTKKVIGDTLVDVKFSGLAWKGNEGLYYSSYDKPKEGSALSAKTDQHKLFYHVLNTAQATDKLIFGGADFPRRYVGANVTDDGRFLVVSAANATSGNELYVKDLKDANSTFTTIVGNMDKNHYILDNNDDQLIIYTELDAPNGKLVTADFKNPDPATWKDLIAETENVLSPSTAGDKIFASYLKDATSHVLQYNRLGKLEKEISLPGVGTASGFHAKRSSKVIYYSFTSYIDPGTIYAYDIASGNTTVYNQSAVQFDPSQYESKQVFYPSKDGTKIPMIITYKKGIKLDGSNPTLLYGYGGFNVSLTPSFSTSNIILLEQGGVYAVANLRGGGEYGQRWHLAGTKLDKQNVFDDFIAAAEYLIAEKFTSSAKLAIAGGSNGGLLVGAAMTQRPSLFKVAFPAVGVLDMLRYHKFTAGAGWAYDYGTSEDSKEMFDYLYNYSPYHALKPNTDYPATMVSTADHDDRVVPAHSFKFAARLQAYTSGKLPALIRIDTNAGHGAGKSTAMVIAEQTDKWSFMFQNLNHSFKELKK